MKENGTGSYLQDKWNNLGATQFDALPEHFRNALIRGTPEEREEAMSYICAMERQQGQTLLSEVGYEFIEDLRSTVTVKSENREGGFLKRLAGKFF